VVLERSSSQKKSKMKKRLRPLQEPVLTLSVT